MADIETDVEALLAGMDEVPDDWEQVDLGLPEAFEGRLAAQMRLFHAKEAAALSWQIPAVRASQPSKVDEMLHSRNTQLMTIARIDRLWPGAKAEAKRIGEAAARREREQEDAVLGR